MRNSSNTVLSGTIRVRSCASEDWKSISRKSRQAKELQSGQVGYEHVGVYVPHLETSVESLVKGFGCTLASMPANQNRVAFIRGPENLMLELIEA